MSKFFSGLFTVIFSVLIIAGIIVWALVTILGGAEILWWIFTGDFFHFVSETAASTW